MSLVSLPSYVAPRSQGLRVRPKTRLRPVSAAPSQAPSSSPSLSAPEAERMLASALQGVKGRGKEGLTQETIETIDRAVAALEADGGVADPTLSPSLDGRWTLLFTTRPGTASPIQRTFTGVEAFSVIQEIDLTSSSPRVNNVVNFGRGVGELKVEAEASTGSRPLPDFTPRRGDGTLFGLNILGKSSNYEPKGKHVRIDFQFDRAAFEFKALPFKIPYPVPFRILGDERKGWIDVTYLSKDGQWRLSRGNKGTLFVLKKEQQ